MESVSDTLVLEIPITYENIDDNDGSPECEFVPRSLPKQPDSMDNEKKVKLEINIKYFLQPSFTMIYFIHRMMVC